MWAAGLALLGVAMAALPFVANEYVVATGLGLLMWLALTQSWCVLSKMTLPPAHLPPSWRQHLMVGSTRQAHKF